MSAIRPFFQLSPEARHVQTNEGLAKDKAPPSVGFRQLHAFHDEPEVVSCVVRPLLES